VKSVQDKEVTVILDTNEQRRNNLQGESSSLCWLTKGKQMQGYYRLNTNIPYYIM